MPDNILLHKTVRDYKQKSHSCVCMLTNVTSHQSKECTKRKHKPRSDQGKLYLSPRFIYALSKRTVVLSLDTCLHAKPVLFLCLHVHTPILLYPCNTCLLFFMLVHSCTNNMASSGFGTGPAQCLGPPSCSPIHMLPLACASFL